MTASQRNSNAKAAKARSLLVGLAGNKSEMKVLNNRERNAKNRLKRTKMESNGLNMEMNQMANQEKANKQALNNALKVVKEKRAQLAKTRKYKATVARQSKGKAQEINQLERSAKKATNQAKAARKGLGARKRIVKGERKKVMTKTIKTAKKVRTTLRPIVEPVYNSYVKDVRPILTFTN